MSVAPTEDIAALLDAVRKEKYGSKAFEILRIISYFVPWDIHMGTFLTLTDNEEHLETIFGLLKKYYIVTPGSNEAVININCSVQKAIQTYEKYNEEEILEKALKMLEPDIKSNVNNMISVWGYACAFPKLVKKSLIIPYNIMVQLISNDRYNDANVFGWKAVGLLKKTVHSNHPILFHLLFSLGTVLEAEGKYKEALDILLPLYEKFEFLSEAREMLKPFMNMPNFLENSEGLAQTQIKSTLVTIGRQLHEMCHFGEALPLYHKLLRNEEVLVTQDNLILQAFHDYALVLNYLGKYKKSLAILKDIIKRRSELGMKGDDLLSVKCTMSTVLLKQFKFEDSYKMLLDVYEEKKVSLGENHVSTLRTKRDLAMALHDLGKHDQALAMHDGLVENMRKVLGKDHIDTLLTLISFAAILRNKGQYQKALVILVKTHKKLNENIGQYNARTLHGFYNTFIHAKYNIALTLLKLKKVDEALEYYKELFNVYDQQFGSNHPDTKSFKSEVAAANGVKFLMCEAASDGNIDYVKDIIIENEFGINFKDSDGKTVVHYSAENGNVNAVQFFLENGAIYNSRDKNDKTPLQIAKNAKAICLLNSVTQLFKYVKLGEYKQLVKLIAERKNIINVKSDDGNNLLHWAAHNGHSNIVQLLLANGAGIAEITNKGNTSLHIATSKNNKGVIEVLLQYVNHENKNNFVNAQTTALHIASKNGSLELVKMLLKYGAAYNIEDSEDKIPSDISTNEDVTNLLTMVKDMFADTKKGNFEVVKNVSESKFDAAYILNACNDQGNSLLDVAKMNNPDLAEHLLKILESNEMISLKTFQNVAIS